jgi:hypothetical protein
MADWDSAHHPGKIDLSAPTPLRRPSFYAARRLYLKMGRRTLTTVALDMGKTHAPGSPPAE